MNIQGYHTGRLVDRKSIFCSVSSRFRNVLSAFDSRSQSSATAACSKQVTKEGGSQQRRTQSWVSLERTARSSEDLPCTLIQIDKVSYKMCHAHWFQQVRLTLDRLNWLRSGQSQKRKTYFSKLERTTWSSEDLPCTLIQIDKVSNKK